MEKSNSVFHKYNPICENTYLAQAYSARFLRMSATDVQPLMQPCGGKEMADPGDMCVMMGGLPHRGPAVDPGTKRGMIFVVTSLQACESDYE